MESNKKEKLLEPQVEDPSVGTAADVDQVMKKYDRESNTRIWEGTPKLIVRILGIAFSCYCIFSTLKGWPTLPEQKLNIFLGLILIMGYLHYPIKKGSSQLPAFQIFHIQQAPDFLFMTAAKLQDSPVNSSQEL